MSEAAVGLAVTKKAHDALIKFLDSAAVWGSITLSQQRQLADTERLLSSLRQQFVQDLLGPPGNSR